MPHFTIDDVDISPSEFVQSCNSKEINELIEILSEGGHLQPEQLTNSKNYGVRRPSVNDEQFWSSLEHLKRCRDLLSIHEENYINNMASKYKHIR